MRKKVVSVSPTEFDTIQRTLQDCANRGFSPVAAAGWALACAGHALTRDDILPLEIELVVNWNAS